MDTVIEKMSYGQATHENRELVNYDVNIYMIQQYM
jgi:hypothetical protein